MGEKEAGEGGRNELRAAVQTNPVRTPRRTPGITECLSKLLAKTKTGEGVDEKLVLVFRNTCAVHCPSLFLNSLSR